MRDEKLEMSKITTTFVTCFSDKMYTFFPKFKGFRNVTFANRRFYQFHMGFAETFLLRVELCKNGQKL